MKNENAEVSAEIEAYKLIASVSDEKHAKFERNEKSIKNMMSLEKHNRRLLKEIEEGKWLLQLQ